MPDDGPPDISWPDMSPEELRESLARMEADRKAAERKKWAPRLWASACLVCRGDLEETFRFERVPGSGATVYGPGGRHQRARRSQGIRCTACGVRYAAIPKEDAMSLQVVGPDVVPPERDQLGGRGGPIDRLNKALRRLPWTRAERTHGRTIDVKVMGGQDNARALMEQLSAEGWVVQYVVAERDGDFIRVRPNQ